MIFYKYYVVIFIKRTTLNKNYLYITDAEIIFICKRNNKSIKKKNDEAIKLNFYMNYII